MGGVSSLGVLMEADSLDGVLMGGVLLTDDPLVEVSLERDCFVGDSLCISLMIKACWERIRRYGNKVARVIDWLCHIYTVLDSCSFASRYAEKGSLGFHDQRITFLSWTPLQCKPYFWMRTKDISLSKWRALPLDSKRNGMTREQITERKTGQTRWSCLHKKSTKAGHPIYPHQHKINNSLGRSYLTGKEKTIRNRNPRSRREFLYLASLDLITSR